MEIASTLHKEWPRDTADGNKTRRSMSLDKNNNKRGNTKAGILEGAIQGLDGLPIGRKIKAVRYRYSKPRPRECSDASNLSLTSSTN